MMSGLKKDKIFLWEFSCKYKNCLTLKFDKKCCQMYQELKIVVFNCIRLSNV